MEKSPAGLIDDVAVIEPKHSAGGNIAPHNVLVRVDERDAIANGIESFLPFIRGMSEFRFHLKLGTNFPDSLHH